MQLQITVLTALCSQHERKAALWLKKLALYSLVFGSNAVSVFSTEKEFGLQSVYSGEGGGQFLRKLFDVFS